MKRRAFLFTSVCVWLFVCVQGSLAGPVYWTDWTSASAGNPGSAIGMITLPDSSTVSVTYRGEIAFAQTSGGTNYWNPPTPYLSATVDNAPPASDVVALRGGNATVNTITFSEPVTNPIMALLSLGQANGYYVYYDFDTPFEILSYGPGYFGGPGTLTELAGDVVRGEEGHGAIQFEGVLTSVSWTSSVYEHWHGFTVGAPETEIVPAPGALLLAGIGTSIIGCTRRRRQV